MRHLLTCCKLLGVLISFSQGEYVGKVSDRLIILYNKHWSVTVCEIFLCILYLLHKGTSITLLVQEKFVIITLHYIDLADAFIQSDLQY